MTWHIHESSELCCKTCFNIDFYKWKICVLFIICSIYFYQICLVFLWKPSRTLTEIIVEREVTCSGTLWVTHWPHDLWIHSLPLWRNGAGLKVSLFSKMLSWQGSPVVLALVHSKSSQTCSKPTKSEFSGEGLGNSELNDSNSQSNSEIRWFS